MRTAPEIISELRKLDPATCMTVSSIRRLVKEGVLKGVKVGNRTLINFEQFLDYLNNPSEETIDEDVTKEKIKPISTNRMDEFKRNIGM